MDENKRPIAVFDSGAGGISVLRELVALMPGENYIYFGDSLNAPYGTKSVDKVRELTYTCIDRLVKMGAKETVIACNTATSAAVRGLRAMYPDMPVVGIEPAVKPAAEYAAGGKVLVMATNLTLKEEKLKRLTDEYKDKADFILLPCPQLVELVESGKTSGTELDNYLTELLLPYKNKVDAVVLGCTHFPLAKAAIQQAVGKVKLFDGGAGTARQAQRLLKKKNMLSDSEKGNISFLSSIDGKEKLYKMLL